MFEEWADTKRLELHRAYSHALSALVRDLFSQRAWRDAASLQKSGVPSIRSPTNPCRRS